MSLNIIQNYKLFANFPLFLLVDRGKLFKLTGPVVWAREKSITKDVHRLEFCHFEDQYLGVVGRKSVLLRGILLGNSKPENKIIL